MEILISGKQAVLKKNTSFDFISENRLFTGSDSYTLTITFPLKGCQQNIDIFGHIHRADVEKSKVVFDCDIRDGSFFKTGTITVTEISETEVKTQFLEGRSEQNYDDTFDDIYINQLDLGYPSATERNLVNVDPNACYLDYPAVNYMPLPWVNNTSGNIQNELTKDSKTKELSWKNSSGTLSFQPYLLHILYKVCDAVGYTGDFSAIESTKYAQLLICNTLPAAWEAWNFAIALPHWSLTEFFEELENFLFGEFEINHKAKTITFYWSKDRVDTAGEVSIEKVLDAYSVEVSHEDGSNYLATSNIKYAENDNRFWAYRDCAWYIRAHKSEAKVYDRLADLLLFASDYKLSGKTPRINPMGKVTGYSLLRGYANRSPAQHLFYAKDVDTYFIMFCYDAKYLESHEIGGVTYNYYEYYNRLEPINQFGERLVDEDAEELELNIVPAWLDDTDDDIGQVIFLECGEMSSSDGWTLTTDASGNVTGSTGYGGTRFGGQRIGTRSNTDDTDYDSGALAQTSVGRAIAKGEQEKSEEYFGNIYVGFWVNRDVTGRMGLSPRPVIDFVETTNAFGAFQATGYSLRLDGSGGVERRQFSHNIDPKKKYTFSFLAKEIPDPRALFYIQGGKYICEKLTATFKEQGMSEKIKGTFYRVID